MDNHNDNLPAALVSRLRETHTEEGFATVMAGFGTPRKTSLRVNTLKSTAADLKRIFRERKIPFEQVEWYHEAFVLNGITAKFLSGLPEYGQGLFYVQNLSSMIPPVILDPMPGESVLDITAAPGSKTTQMAAMMLNGGTILANDRSTIRRMKLMANLSVQGVLNTTVSGFPAQILWKKFPETFDRVLVDVPCSMEGTIRIHLPKTYADWSPGKVRTLSAVQKSILRSAVSAAKPGATIVYSSCTLSIDENEDVVDWIIRKEKGAVIPDKFSIPHLFASSGIQHWKSRSFEHLSGSVLRILPSQTMEGFFVAKLKKVRSTVPESLRSQ